jgi:hypothetical protein
VADHLDPATLGTKRMLVLMAVNASWLTRSLGPDEAQVAEVGGWSSTRAHNLVGELVVGGWLTGVSGPHDTHRLTHAAYQALGWDEPIARVGA